jgi:PilZ domain-containing protein
LNFRGSSPTIRATPDRIEGDAMITILPRARRVQLPLTIMYRRSGDDHWFHGKVVNISESGALFGPTELELGTPIEIILSPPIPVGTLAPGKQVCLAEVVRTTSLGAVAVRFDECRFLLEA